MNSHFTAIFDSCVLYHAPLRDLLIQLASARLYRGKLSTKINQEWVENLLKNRKDLKPEQLARTCKLIEESIPDCMVTGHEKLIKSISLPDPNDRHVLAAAILCKAQVIVTYNLKDFPADTLEEFDIEAQHPDVFLRSQAEISPPPLFLKCVKEIRDRLKNPAKSAQDYLLDLNSLSLVQTSTFLNEYIDNI